jgi:Immunity protein 53
MITNNLIWLMDWYAEQCNGDWEHSYGVKIETLDNPGWSVTIDLEDTDHNKIGDKAWQSVKIDDTNWYGYKIEDGKFEASGDPSKLDYLIQLFREIVDQKT